LILGGAVGNVVDSTFYGVLLNNAPDGSPTPWFHGQVIDMLYFPMFDFVWPQWVPFLGGRYFEFFSPVFNIADSSIFIGVVIILIMQKKFFKEGVLAPANPVITEVSNEHSPSDESAITENRMKENSADTPAQ
jgi:signal peptidase II